MSKRTETDDEIRVVVPEGGYCQYCPAATAHQHVWTKPKRCEATFEGDRVWGEALRCQHDAGHDEGPFPRYAWDHGLDNVLRVLTRPTPHFAEWS